jgi:hypothetical protein
MSELVMNTHTNDNAVKVLGEVADALRTLLSEHEEYWTGKIRGNADKRQALIRQLIDSDPTVVAARTALTRAICVLDQAAS